MFIVTSHNIVLLKERKQSTSMREYLLRHHFPNVNVSEFFDLFFASHSHFSEALNRMSASDGDQVMANGEWLPCSATRKQRITVYKVRGAKCLEKQQYYWSQGNVELPINNSNSSKNEHESVSSPSLLLDCVLNIECHVTPADLASSADNFEIEARWRVEPVDATSSLLSLSGRVQCHNMMWGFTSSVERLLVSQAEESHRRWLEAATAVVDEWHAQRLVSKNRDRSARVASVDSVAAASATPVKQRTAAVVVVDRRHGEPILCQLVAPTTLAYDDSDSDRASANECDDGSAPLPQHASSSLLPMHYRTSKANATATQRRGARNTGARNALLVLFALSIAILIFVTLFSEHLS
jgi:hypothetical protein